MTDYKLVPVEPTPEMERAAESYWNERRFMGLSDDPRTWAGVYQAMLSAAPAVQGESVVEAAPMPGAKGFTMACFSADQVPVGTRLYTAPQPTEQQPAPDVAALVKTLQTCRDELMWMIERHNQQNQNDAPWLYDYQTVVEADAALAAYRKGGEV